MMNVRFGAGLLAAILLLGSSAQAAPKAAPQKPAPAMTAQDLDAFFSGLVPYALHRADIPGAVLVIVKDGKILFAKGYGYADVKTQRAVNPATTLFRPGSVSKLLHLDGRNATRAGRQDRSRCGRE